MTERETNKKRKDDYLLVSKINNETQPAKMQFEESKSSELQFEERKKRIEGYISDESYIPMNALDLACVLCVPEAERDVFVCLLDELVDEGRIIKSKKKRYLPLASRNAKVGIFRSTGKGFGFVSFGPDYIKDDDIHVGAAATGSAIHGDTVLVGIDENNEGEVLRIIQRSHTSIVGTYRCKKNGAYAKVVPDDRHIGMDFIIAGTAERTAGGNRMIYPPRLNDTIQNTRLLKNGQKVVAKITKWPSDSRAPECTVTEIIGMFDDPGVDVMSIIRTYDIPEEFPDSVLVEADSISETIDIEGETASGRRDLRDLMTITIDGADAKDLDDAVSVERLENGFRLGVHIADVSHYVNEDSEIDKEAINRGTSVYFVDRVIPMLPERLSNDICSLNPHTPRLTFSVLMTIDEKGVVVDHEIFESIISTTERMTYDDVYTLLEDNDCPEKLSERYSGILPTLQDMKQLSGLLRKRREARGGVDFNFTENTVILDDEGVPIDIVPREITIANNIIEDFMLAANETVAEHFCWESMPFVYRNHEKPDVEKTKKLATFLYNRGIRLKSPNDPHPKAFQEVLENCKNLPEERVISTITLRTMQKAEYAAENEGHFGLAAKFYTHFTSPIRRYPDLLIHRMMKSYLKGDLHMDESENSLIASTYDMEKLTQIARRCSMTERRAEDAERDVECTKKLEYMKQFVGEEFSGVISGVTSFGIFVELENSVEGMLHINNMLDDYYVYNENDYSLIGERTGKTYRLGDSAEIIIVSVEPQARRLDVMLSSDCDSAGFRKPRRSTTHSKNSKRTRQS